MTQPPIDLLTAIADSYRIDRELGSGGMATVYLAHDLRHQRKVALKVIRPELANSVDGDRFLAEIRTTSNLQHPHIPGLIDSGRAKNLVFYVMPFVEGDTVRARLQRDRQLPVEEALRITRDVALALDYAHRRGVIHRDIKPENILLQDGQAMVADFGVALAVSEAASERLTQTGVSIGTPQYMSPEQAMGDRHLTPRSDIYSLGCVLYEMLTGETPQLPTGRQDRAGKYRARARVKQSGRGTAGNCFSGMAGKCWLQPSGLVPPSALIHRACFSRGISGSSVVRVASSLTYRPTGSASSCSKSRPPARRVFK